MKNEKKTKEQLLNEVEKLNAKIARLMEFKNNCKKGGELLLEREERLLALFNAAPDPVFIKDTNGRYLEANSAFATLFGLPIERIVGNTDDNIFTPKEAEKIRIIDQKLFHGGESIKTEDHLIVQGEPHVFKTRKIPLHDAQGKITSLCGFAEDVTEEMRARKALKESEERYRSLIENIPDVSWTTNSKGHTIFISPNVERIYGYTTEEIYEEGNKLWFERIHPDDINKLKTAFNELLEKGIPLYIEYRIKRKDGKWIWLLDKSIGTYERDGITYADGIFSDISNRKRVEEDHKQLQVQFAQAQKMESVGRLAGGVAQDFNNILSVIIGRTELALTKVDPSQPLHNDLREILKSAKRSAEIIQRLLAFARKQTIMPRVLDLNYTLEGMLKMLWRLIGEDIDLAWLPESDLRPVKMDPTQLDQILANLCVNARDAIAGVGKITIETASVTFDEDYYAEHLDYVPGEFILLAFSDDGCGMDKNTQDKIFEPFFTTKEMGKGTGFGLSTLYGIVKQNNGFVNVYSEQGKGTTFKIYLPIHTDQNVKELKGNDAPIYKGRGEMLLVVEDETSILELIETMLDSLGYRVLTARTPAEALDLVVKHTGEISMLITDVVMPEMNGRELAERLQSSHPKLKCLYMSGYTANIIAHRGILDQGVSFIQKPFLMKDLAEKVRMTLNGK